MNRLYTCICVCQYICTGTGSLQLDGLLNFPFLMQNPGAVACHICHAMWRFHEISINDHKWGYPNAWMVYDGNSHDSHEHIY